MTSQFVADFVGDKCESKTNDRHEESDCGRIAVFSALDADPIDVSPEDIRYFIRRRTIKQQCKIRIGVQNLPHLQDELGWR